MTARLKIDVLEFLQAVPDAIFWDNVTNKQLKRMTKYNKDLGLPTIMGCHDGYFVGIELKCKVCKLTKAEEAFKTQLLNAGGQYWILRSFEDLTLIAKKKGWI